MSSDVHTAHDAYESPEMPDLDEPEASSVAARRGTLLAWAVLLAAIVPTVVGLLLMASTWDAAVPDAYGFRGFPTIFALTFSTLGALILARRPGNVIGALFAIGAIESGLQVLASEYATYGLVAHPGSLPGPEIAAWTVSWTWLISVISLPLMFLVFPDGRFLTPRWRIVLGTTIVGATGFGTLLAFRPGPIENASFAVNPFGSAVIGQLEPLANAFALTLVLSLVAASASLVLRYRRAGPTERLQLRWIAFAALLLAVAGPLGFSGQKFGQVAFILAIVAVPAAAGIAVLRYRLYDIDLIINRTLVYGLLTAILAGLYAGTVALLQRVFVTVTGGGSDAAIVLSTVVVVSFFTPVRTRLQRFVDRRFKEVGDPRVRLAEFVATIETGIWRLEPDAVLRRLLEVSAAALGAPKASVVHGERVVASVGSGAFEPALMATAGDGPARVSVSVGARAEGAPYVERDRVALESAVAVVAEALAGRTGAAETTAADA
ncbi:MAG: hypothetical protein ACRDF7_01560 [Candidatus Limnocylindrales bacterium]